MGQGVVIDLERFRSLADGFSGGRSGLADKANVSSRTLDRIYKGGSPNKATLDRLARAMEIRADRLYPGNQGHGLQQALVDAMAAQLACLATETAVIDKLKHECDWQANSKLSLRSREERLDKYANMLAMSMTQISRQARNERDAEIKYAALRLVQKLMQTIVAGFIKPGLTPQQFSESLFARAPGMSKAMIAALLQYFRGGVIGYEIDGDDEQPDDERLTLDAIFSLNWEREGSDYLKKVGGRNGGAELALVDKCLWSLHLDVFKGMASTPKPAEMRQPYPKVRQTRLQNYLLNELGGLRTGRNHVIGMYFKSRLDSGVEEELVGALKQRLPRIPFILIQDFEWEPAGFLLDPMVISARMTDIMAQAIVFRVKSSSRSDADSGGADDKGEGGASRAGKPSSDPAAARKVKAKAGKGDGGFDVFLCHNSKDKDEVRDIKKQLRRKRIKTWFDEDQMQAGDDFIDEISTALERIASVAVFIGSNGRGPWQDKEIKAALNLLVRSGCKVIPVLLASCKRKPKLPLFLQPYVWVDFRQQTPSPLQALTDGVRKAVNNKGK